MAWDIWKKMPKRDVKSNCLAGDEVKNTIMRNIYVPKKNFYVAENVWVIKS